ncbi:hypothetical protein MMPV_001450 [Pyropia vietnamensis]
MSSSGGSGPPRGGATLPAAKALSPVARRRLGKELDEWLSAEPPVPGMSVSATERLDLWMVMVTGAENTVFANEEYVLRFSFPADVRWDGGHMCRA